ncbi:hypothetical protein JHK82_042789 [Glycine max]|uniref:Uncharacterized protein n=1 Tax=Glycine soja TaxID=3848 RepID=A0A445GVB5_GLYSO|nr:hypothetical protein JHK87_042697 [Glycine soja]KAG4949573.1 hypothetical protein JHK86_042812 [Glycine max]KAG4957070.1 hypothetical protein JHK85_043450 [Glycine max]KAG5105819.1 hypothetical protein JHK82_042789 [Glycine max]KAG5116910.1 hypothetical protein JHK84_043023 [Glycine max]
MKLNKIVILIPRGKENVLCYKEIYLTEGFHEFVFKLQENISHHQQDFCNSGYASVEYHERELRMLNYGRLNLSSVPVKWYTMPKKFCMHNWLN